MRNELIQMEQEGRALRQAGEFRRAVDVFTALVEKQPDWEHGLCYHEMAGCYEAMGRLQEAEQQYRLAVSYEPNCEIYLGGLASFLYLYGQLQDAFDTHLNLVTLYASRHDQKNVDSIIPTLKELGSKLGMTDDDVLQRIHHFQVDVHKS